MRDGALRNDHGCDAAAHTKSAARSTLLGGGELRLGCSAAWRRRELLVSGTRWGGVGGRGRREGGGRGGGGGGGARAERAERPGAPRPPRPKNPAPGAPAAPPG